MTGARSTGFHDRPADRLVNPDAGVLANDAGAGSLTLLLVDVARQNGGMHDLGVRLDWRPAVRPSGRLADGTVAVYVGTAVNGGEGWP